MQCIMCHTPFCWVSTLPPRSPTLFLSLFSLLLQQCGFGNGYLHSRQRHKR